MNEMNAGPAQFNNQQPVTPPPPIKKPFFQRPWFIVIASLVVLFILGSLGLGGNKTDDATPPTESESPAVATPEKPAEEPAETQEPAEPTDSAPPPAKKQWVQLATLSGSADKNSDTITTTGGKIRLTYKFTSSDPDYVVAALYFLDEGTDVDKEGAIPVVMISEPLEDSTTLRKPAGEYYVMVRAANVDYTVTVEEER